MINVTKPFLPPQEEFNKRIEDIWERDWLTNNGPLVQELEEKLQQYLDVSSLHLVTNGTMALQLAIKTLDLTGEIITTPFSFVATTTSIIWENCTPVYVDIRPDTFCIDADKIEAAITEKTSAILATHVYGIPCDVEKIDQIAKKYNLKVIYDGAHAFGVKYKGKSIFNYGDISTYSFHATKVYHTTEGGAITCNGNISAIEKAKLLRNYGFVGNEFYYPGINAKMSEFHAAMGLCNLPYFESNVQKRKEICELYNELLPDIMQVISVPDEIDYNYAYYPILLSDTEVLEEIIQTLVKNKINTRRYFNPSLNSLPYLETKYDCPISEDISNRILCLPLYSELETQNVKKITSIINEIIFQRKKY